MPKQNTPPADYPQAVIRQIEQLAHHIVTARKRRKETQAQWAQRLGVSQPTMARIERGDPAVAMASYVMCMWLVNQAHGLAELIAPQNDHASLEQEVARTRTRRKPATKATMKKAETTSASGSMENPASPTASAIRVVEISTTSKRAKKIAGAAAVLDPGSAFEEAMKIAAMGPRLELEKALRSAGMGLGGTNPNGTAAGLASLIFSSKKARS